MATKDDLAFKIKAKGKIKAQDISPEPLFHSLLIAYGAYRVTRMTVIKIIIKTTAAIAANPTATR
jgi:hypothetical protein